MNHIRKRFAIAAVAAAVVLAGCGYEETAVPEPPAEAEHTPADDPTCTTDESTLASEPASDAGGPAVDRILEAGVLRVGVSADTYLMASRNPRNNRIEGFDIEVVKAIGEAIFGDRQQGFSLNRDVQLRVITAGDRIDLLKDGALDLVVRNFTINCTRKQEIAFSAEYYHATQKVLVPLEEEGAYTGPAWLAEEDEQGDAKSVCAPAGSTSLDNIEDVVDEVELDPSTTHTGCLIKFQRGEVDAITGDDTVLAGLAAQDPYAVVPDQEALSDEPYGVGINKAETDLVAFVNYALERMVETNSWERAYNRWLRGELGEGSPPAAIS